MPEPGEVFYLPPERGEAPRTGDRPHVLLSGGGESSEVATLAYGSTQSTDAQHGAEHVFVDPAATAYRGTGLIHPTYLYPSRLVSYPREAIGASSGRLVDEMPRIRASLKRALGVGLGVTGEPFHQTIVPVLDEECETRALDVAIAIVPVLDEECETRALDVAIADDRLLAALGPGYGTAVLAIPMVSTLYQPEHIRRWLYLVAQPELMLEVEAALTMHFGL